MISFEPSTVAEFQAQAQVLREMESRARRLNLDLLVVGAVARDLLIRGVTGRAPDRATHDLDVAVAVEDWPALTRLTSDLTPVRGVPHAFVVDGIQVDIVPFAGVEEPDRSIIWPNDHRMSVLGMTEALRDAVTVDLGVVRVKVASLRAQMILKLLAWKDRHLSDGRDAIDLRSIILAYSDDPYSERIPIAIQAAYDFDLELAGAHLIGMEALTLMDDGGTQIVVDLLSREGSDEGLLPGQMGLHVSRNRQLLQALTLGADKVATGRFRVGPS